MNGGNHIYTIDDLAPSVLHGKLFCFDHTDGRPLIIDYTSLDREFIFSDEDLFLEVGDKKTHEIIESMEELKKKVKALTTRTVKARIRHYLPPITREDLEFVVDQIIVDILFNMYLVSQEKITLRQYCISMCNALGERSSIEATRKLMERAVKEEAELYDNDIYRDRIIKLGRSPINEASKMSILNEPFERALKRRKLEWDYLYYNYNSKLLTSKQYQRRFSRSRHNNDRYEKFIAALTVYDDFVAKLLPTNDDSDLQYFEKSMDYYYLERYKRIDFMYKLATKMEELEFSKIDSEYFLVKRFHPCVVCPSLNNNENGDEPLNLRVINKPYAPLSMFEDNLLNNVVLTEDEKINDLYADQHNALHNIRAITYELFIYHYTFVPDGYAEIADFIRNSYPVTNLHEPNKIWKQIEETGWYDTDAVTRKKIKKIINHMERINDDALFWESAVRQRARRK